MADSERNLTARISVEGAEDFNSAMERMNQKARETQRVFRDIERTTRPLGMALTSIGVAGLAAAEATKEWDNYLGKALQTLKPVFATMTAFGGLLLTVPPIIRGVKVAIDTLKASMIALRAATIGVQGAFGLLTLGIGMIGAGIYLLATHGRHLKNVTADTDRWTKALDSANDRLKVLESNGQGATREAEILRDTIEGLTTALSEFDSIGEDNKVTVYNLEQAYGKLADAQQALISYQQTLAADEAAGRDATEFGRQQMELRRTLIADTLTDIAELTVGIEELKQVEIDEAESLRNDAVKDIEAYYGFREDAQMSLLQQAENAADAARDSLNDQMEEARRAHDYVIRLAQNEYDTKVSLLQDQTNAVVKELQAQLGILDWQQTADDRARKDKEFSDKESELRSLATSGWSRAIRAKAQAELDALLEDRAKELADRQREDARESLQQAISDVQDAAAQKEAEYQAELDAVTEQQNNMLDAIETRIDAELTLAESALEAKKNLLQQEFDAAVKAQNDLRDNAIATINDVIAATQIAANAPVDVTQSASYQALQRYLARRAAENSDVYAGGGIAGFATGTDILEPTLLYGLKSQRPLGIASEYGQTEHVGPGPLNASNGGSFNVTLNINNPVIREETDIRKMMTEAKTELGQLFYRDRQVRGNYGNH